MNKRVYGAISIRHVQIARIPAAAAAEVVAGVDVSKLDLQVVLRWSDGRFDKPWRVQNPTEVPRLIELLKTIGVQRKLTVAMEPTGTYGEALRQALHDAGIELHLVSGKRAHDYAEVFDGVPSQHDGKDAAVVAELCAHGKSSRWRWSPPDQTSQQIELVVDQMQAANRLKAMWLGRLEGMLGRCWPEATRQLPLGSGTMMRALSHYGGPAAMSADAQLAQRLGVFCGGKFNPQRIGRIIACARQTLGVRQTPTDQQHVRWCAQQALAAHCEVGRCQRRLNELAADHPVITRQGTAIGMATACVLWMHLGDPRQYHCAAAYRKAMGLNLRERSSGQYRGQLKISKRGSGVVRQWLYLCALRLIRNQPKVKRWYLRKLRRRGGMSKTSVITALTRKLALSMWAIVRHEESFEVERMLGPRHQDHLPRRQNCSAAPSGRKGATIAAR